MITIERIDSIRFERTFDDGAKVSFSVEEPKSIIMENSNSLIDAGKFGNVKITGIKHEWISVFSPYTRIIISGKVKKEIKVGVGGTIYHEGEFDFEELCNGNIIKC